MDDRRLVYSSDSGRVAAPPPRQHAAEGRSRKGGPAAPDDGVVRILRERGGRGGKTVSVVRGLPERAAALEALAQELKRLCGAGGTVRDGAIELQGDHRERIAAHLRALGHTVKLAGG